VALLAIILEWTLVCVISLGLFIVARRYPYEHQPKRLRWVLIGVGPIVVASFVLIRRIETVGWRVALMMFVFVVAVLLLTALCSFQRRDRRSIS
jgi:ABC-type uncharacterized transport system permease subunit